MNQRVILEIAVDKNNEKGVLGAVQILNTLHGFAGKKGDNGGGIGISRGAPYFTFQIISHKGIIRFYIRADDILRNTIEDQFYSQYPEIQIREVSEPIPETRKFLLSRVIGREYSLSMIRTFASLDSESSSSFDAFSSITGALAKIENAGMGIFHVDFAPIKDSNWRSEEKKRILGHPVYPRWLKKLIMYSYGFTSVLFFPILFFRVLGGRSGEGEKQGIPLSQFQKTDAYGFEVRIFVAVSDSDITREYMLLQELQSSLGVFSNPLGNALHSLKPMNKFGTIFASRPRFDTLLNTLELAGLVHLPTLAVTGAGIHWVMSKKLQPPSNLPVGQNITPIGVTDFRGRKMHFGIRQGDRLRHIYIVGKTGMGKSTLLENMICSDIITGKGVAVIDPHGDLADTILKNIPKSRTNDVILFDPSDRNFPTAFNMLEAPTGVELYPVVASGLLSVFKRIFGEKSWGPRLEYILRNTIFTLLYAKDATLLSIPLILTHPLYRQKIVSKLEDPSSICKCNF